VLWFKRHYGLADYRQEFERFEEMFNSQHGPRDMMMVSAGLGDETTVYFYLPNRLCSLAIKTRFKSASSSPVGIDDPTLRIPFAHRKILAMKTCSRRFAATAT